MTREQAINYLISSGFSEEQVSEVVRALTYEPIIKSDLGVDCISRQAVLEGIAEWIADGYADSEADCSHISSLVTHLPSVTPQEPCDKCEVGNPCLYCKHEFEPQESEDNI